MIVYFLQHSMKVFLAKPTLFSAWQFRRGSHKLFFQSMVMLESRLAKGMKYRNPTFPKNKSLSTVSTDSTCNL
jgi:hypothetical protein